MITIEYTAKEIERIKKELKINSEYPKIVRDKSQNVKLILIHKPNNGT